MSNLDGANGYEANGNPVKYGYHSAPQSDNELRKQIVNLADVNPDRGILGYYLNDIMELIKAHSLQERIDELKHSNTEHLAHQYSEASKHKWYRYYDDRIKQLEAEKGGDV